MAEIPLTDRREHLKTILTKIQNDSLSHRGQARYKKVSTQLQYLSTVNAFVLSDQQVGKIADEIFSLVFLDKRTENLAKIRKNAAEIVMKISEYNEMKKAKLGPPKNFSEMNIREIFDKLRCWCQGKWTQEDSNMIIRVVNLEKLRLRSSLRSWELQDPKVTGRLRDWKTAQESIEKKKMESQTMKIHEDYEQSVSSDEEYEETCQLDVYGKIEFLSDQGVGDIVSPFNEKKYKLILDNVIDQDDISTLSSRILPLNDSRINEELRALRGCSDKTQLRQFLSIKKYAEWFIDSIIQEVEVCLMSDYEEEMGDESEVEVKQMTYEEYDIVDDKYIKDVIGVLEGIFPEESGEDSRDDLTLLKPEEGFQLRKKKVVKEKIVNYLDTRLSAMSATSIEKIHQSDSSIIHAKNFKLSIGDFDLKTGRQIILEFISLWKLNEGWCYCVNFLRRETDSTTDYYYYEVKWSRPTIAFPVPVASVSVFFTIEVSRILPLKCPVNVTYVFEGTSCVHEFDDLKEPEKFLWDILENKLRLCKTVGHLKIF